MGEEEKLLHLAGYLRGNGLTTYIVLLLKCVNQESINQVNQVVIATDIGTSIQLACELLYKVKLFYP